MKKLDIERAQEILGEYINKLMSKNNEFWRINQKNHK